MTDIGLAKSIRTTIKDGDLPMLKAIFAVDPKRLHLTTAFGTWLHDAARSGQYEIAKWLISQGIEINSIGGVVEKSPIDIAAGKGHLEIVRLLVENGARIDVSAPERNPLFAAVYGDHSIVVQYLIDKGVDPTIQYNGRDAKAFAKEWGRASSLHVLEGYERSSHD